MKPFKRENLYPVNLESAKALRELNQAPQRSQLHSLQLAAWALTSGVAQPNESLLLVMNRLLDAHPKWVVKQLRLEELKNYPKDPKELSLFLVQEIEAWIRDWAPEYQDELNYLNKQQGNGKAV